MTNGFSMVEFMDLPSFERCLVRLLLRKVTMTDGQLRDAVASLPLEQRMDDSRLSATLDHLTRD
ncbi:MAG: hypothetical protein ABI835_21105, partial [Chloroflexota bacterium]